VADEPLKAHISKADEFLACSGTVQMSIDIFFLFTARKILLLCSGLYPSSVERSERNL
jgi:hypothetical protein